MSNKKIHLLMVLTSIFWSGAFITGKIAVGEFPPFALTFFRFFFALPFIFAILYLREPGNLIPRGRQWLPLIFLGFIGTFCYHSLFFTSLKYTTATNSSIIGAMNPMVTTLLAAMFFSERLTPWRIFGIFLSFIGVFLFITNGDLQLVSQFRFNKGDVVMLIAVCCFAIYSLLSRRYMKQYSLSPLMVTAYTFLICVVISIPFFLWENPSTYLFSATASGWLSILYMSVFASVLGYLIQMVAIQRIGAPRTAIYINLVPIFTIIQSVTILGESITLFKLIGAAIVITGVYLAIRPEAKGKYLESSKSIA
ncbi:DMT family transporter [Desulfosporosinus metallidurans]|uniref:Permease of the drug/metabolite transporter (DMT) superfamily n=1 Tax=Desulfosporosinus metallidurans TaxID=1888891 RepID=A0A1Q8QIU7_9FIRM|nr:DMT family transporter [Desulfosporosinus metallidurans]OLN27232.1 Permease of the drug/metabolite transporter (DMT) superfamily [Desulfosporosinus metallidurans]